MTEEWKDIKNYEGIYQASSLGRIRSLDRIDTSGKRRKGRVLKRKYDGEKYPCVILSKGGNPRTFHVHRLVAETFIPNTENKPTVNHIDENKENNMIDNLEWMTYKENAHHGTRIQRCYSGRDYEAIGRKISDTQKRKYINKPVIQYDLNMNMIAEYKNVYEAAEQNHIDHAPILRVIRGDKKFPHYKRYIWKLKG